MAATLTTLRRLRYRLLSVSVVVLAALAPATAGAIPAFARRTGMGCSACHVSWPKLNDFGEAFRDRGYRVRDDNPDPRDRSLDYVPIAFRSTGAYLGTVSTHQATDTGDATVRTGTMLPTGADLLFGTALSEHVSAFAVATGFADDGAVTLESDWVRINDIGTSWANLKIGRHELDLPLSEHRTYTLTSDFAIYHYHPNGSANGFSIGDNQLGFELMGHGNGPGLRYAVSVVSAQDNPGSANVFGAHSIYGHVTWTTLPRSRRVARVRVGALFDAGAWPTTFRTLTSGGTPEPVPGTGGAEKPYLLGGAEAAASFGPLAHPLDVTAFWSYGREDKALVAGATRAATWHGGFLQVDYTPILELTAYARLDAVSALTQGDPTQPRGAGNERVVTAGVRRALWISPWGAATVHVEASSAATQDAGATPGTSVNVTTTMIGLDFAL